MPFFLSVYFKCDITTKKISKISVFRDIVVEKLIMLKHSDDVTNVPKKRPLCLGIRKLNKN